MAAAGTGAYQSRWGGNNTYEFRLEKESLAITLTPRAAKCTYSERTDPTWSGDSIYAILSNDSINAPSNLEDLLEYLRLSWRKGKPSDEKVESELQELISWVNNITELNPKTDYWETIF